MKRWRNTFSLFSMGLKDRNSSFLTSRDRNCENCWMIRSPIERVNGKSINIDILYIDNIINNLIICTCVLFVSYMPKCFHCQELIIKIILIIIMYQQQHLLPTACLGETFWLDILSCPRTGLDLNTSWLGWDKSFVSQPGKSRGSSPESSSPFWIDPPCIPFWTGGQTALLQWVHSAAGAPKDVN